MFGICNLSVAPLRNEASFTSEMTNQVVFGEHFTVIEKNKDWSKIQLSFDGFEGYIDNKQYEIISEEIFNKLSKDNYLYSGELIDFITDENNQLTTIPMGSFLASYKDNVINLNNKQFTYEGAVFGEKQPKSSLIKLAFLFLNTPEFHGGKTPFGFDASGFIQTVYRLCGFNLLRSVTEQASQGDVLSFIEEAEPGDLAFFDDEEGIITHVGIVMQDYNIIHVFGKVRIDKLDHSGIYNLDTKKHTHKLRMIKSMV